MHLKQTSQCLFLLLFFTLLLIPAHALALPSGLIHLWRADGNTLDSIGGVTGTLSGDTGYASGVSGHAFSFDGYNDLFTAAVNIGPNSMTQVTFGAWIYLDSFDNDRGWVSETELLDVYTNGFGTVPEPATLLLICTGRIGLAGIRRRA